MKKPYDYLLTDKIPFFQVSQSFIMVDRGCIVSVSSIGEVTQIPVASLLVLCLGAGCSITSDAARLCAKHDCYIAYVRGGLNVHSIWHTGRYHDPKFIAKQAIMFSDPDKKLLTAKKLLKKRMLREGATEDILTKINSASDMYSLLSLEGVWARKVFSELRADYNVSFSRDHDTITGVNGKISLLNNLLYNYCTALVLSLGLSPSLGFVHGTTRRGGLVFDLADIFKYELCLKPAFESPNVSNQKAMYALSSKLRKNRGRIAKEMISVIHEILDLS